MDLSPLQVPRALPLASGAATLQFGTVGDHAPAMTPGHSLPLVQREPVKLAGRSGKVARDTATSWRRLATRLHSAAFTERLTSRHLPDDKFSPSLCLFCKFFIVQRRPNNSDSNNARTMSPRTMQAQNSSTRSVSRIQGCRRRTAQLYSLLSALERLFVCRASEIKRRAGRVALAMASLDKRAQCLAGDGHCMTHSFDAGLLIVGSPKKRGHFLVWNLERSFNMIHEVDGSVRNGQSWALYGFMGWAIQFERSEMQFAHNRPSRPCRALEMRSDGGHDAARLLSRARFVRCLRSRVAWQQI